MTCTAARHGDHTAYDVDECRCPEARADHARYERLRSKDALMGRPRRIDATGTRRRVEALMAIGYSTDDLARRLGYTDGQAVCKFRRHRWIFRDTAARVAALYVSLADVPGPSSRTRCYAERAGLLGPLWWDDDTIDDPAFTPAVVDVPRQRDDVDPVVVDRLVSGTPVDRPTWAERLAAYRRLTAVGWSYVEIQERLHVSGMTLRELIAAADAASIGAAA